MSVQVKSRRDTSANVAAFTGAAGEIVVDATNHRIVLQDGATAGGWPAAKLSEVQTVARRSVSDANCTVALTDRTVAYTALTAARTVALPSAASYPTGTMLIIIDETGACSATNVITIDSAGSDTICGLASVALNAPFMSAMLESNGANRWTLLANDVNEEFATLGVGTSPDPANPLSVYGSSSLFNGVNFNIAINKSASSNTASIIFQDGFSGRAQMGLNGSDNYSFKVSPDGISWTTAIAIDAATGAPTFANYRTAVADANYVALTTDREIAYTAISAARTVTLPAASGFPAGHVLLVVDESGSASPTSAITVAPAGADRISGRTSAAITSAYGHIRLIGNHSNQWNVVGRSVNVISIAASASPFVYTPTPGLTKCDLLLIGGGGGGGGGALQAPGSAVSGGGGGGGGALVLGTFTALQIGASQTVTIGAGGAGGAAAASSATAGGAGGPGGNTTFGSSLAAYGGGGGAGGQLGGASGGGGGAGSLSTGGSSTNATAGAAGVAGGVAGGAGSTGSGATGNGGAGGGGGGAGAAFAGGSALFGGSGGGSGGGITSGNAAANGANGGLAGIAGTSAAGGAGAGAAGTSPSISARDLQHFVGSGGAGGASATSLAFAGGGGGAPGGGGGGGGSAQNGGAAGAGGAGGSGFAILIEYF